jgi:hypothetical protein
MSKNSPLQNVRAMTEWLSWALKNRIIQKPKQRKKKVEDSTDILIKDIINSRLKR